MSYFFKLNFGYNKQMKKNRQPFKVGDVVVPISWRNEPEIVLSAFTIDNDYYKIERMGIGNKKPNWGIVQGSYKTDCRLFEKLTPEAVKAGEFFLDKKIKKYVRGIEAQKRKLRSRLK
jgi:hypothetical protein